MNETTSSGVSAATQQNVNAIASFGTLLVFALFTTALMIILIVAIWKIFTKAGEPGWKSLIPVYNSYILLKISGMSGWWLLAAFIPIGNVVMLVLNGLNLGKSFGKSTTYSVFALVLFSLVGYLMLGLGKSTYVGPGGLAAGSTPTPPTTPTPVAPTMPAV